MEETILNACKNYEEITKEKAALPIPGAYSRIAQHNATKALTEVVKTVCDVPGMTPAAAVWVFTTAAEVVHKAVMNKEFTPQREPTAHEIDEYLEMCARGHLREESDISAE